MENIESNLSTLKQKHPNLLDQKRFELERKINSLKEFCQEFDPYQEITSEHKEFLNNHEIFQFDDPFFITNKLLLLTENLIEELEEMNK